LCEIKTKTETKKFEKKGLELRANPRLMGNYSPISYGLVRN
jgi:hypothetical protein